MLSHLPTLRIKNRRQSKLMRVLHIEDTNQYLLIPKGVYIGYDLTHEPRIYVRWGGVGSENYSYKHCTVSGLLTAYCNLITSEISLKRSGMFDSKGFMTISGNGARHHVSKLFKVYDNELDALLAMRSLLSQDSKVDIKTTLDTNWINLKELTQ